MPFSVLKNCGAVSSTRAESPGEDQSPAEEEDGGDFARAEERGAVASMVTVKRVCLLFNGMLTGHLNGAAGFGVVFIGCLAV